MSEMHLGGTLCALRWPDDAGVDVLALPREETPADFLATKRLAAALAEERMGDSLLLSWYDRDRDREAPSHARECDRPGAPPGYLE